MGIRFRRSLRLAPGVRVNFGLRGPSLSLGPRGAGVTFGAAGVTTHAGIPGTGLSFRETRPYSRPVTPGPAPVASPTELTLHASLDPSGRLALSDPGGVPLDPRLERRVRRDSTAQLEGWLAAERDRINGVAAGFGELHAGTPPPEPAPRYTPQPFATPEPQPPARWQPGVLDRLLPPVGERHAVDHQADLESWKADHARWERARAEHEAAEAEAARRFDDSLRHDEHVMAERLAAALDRVPWPHETVADFHLGDDGRALELDLALPAFEDTPSQVATLAQRGLKVNLRARSLGDRARLYARHVHGMLFRAIGEGFAALPAVETATASGFVRGPDPATGHEAARFLLSARVTRAAWRGIDFAHLDAVDPVLALARFELRSDPDRQGTLRPVEPFAPLDPGAMSAPANAPAAP